MRPKHPISVVTNLAFPLACLTASWPVIAAGVFLMGGSCWYHWTTSWTGQKADEIGIYVYYLQIIAWQLGGDPAVHGFLAVVALAIALMPRRFHEESIALMVLIAVGIEGSLQGPEAIVTLGLFGAAYGLRQIGSRLGKAGDPRGHDIFHGIGWHIVAALASYSLITEGVMNWL